MPIVVIEKPESRKIRHDSSGKVLTRLWTVKGTNSEDEVYDALLAANEVAFGNLVRGALDADSLGGGVWTGVVEYSSLLNESQTVGVTPVEPEAPGEESPLNSSAPGGYNAATLAFDTSGGTTHITQSLETVHRIAAGGGANSAPNQKNAIGVTRDAVVGCDIFSPKLEITIGFEVPVVTLAYVKRLKNLTGKTNEAPFWGFAAGEMLFLGATGQSTSEGRWSLSMKIATGENQVNVQLTADILLPTVGAWEYVWCAYSDAIDGANRVMPPAAAYVERVYRKGNFNDLGLGG